MTRQDKAEASILQTFKRIKCSYYIIKKNIYIYYSFMELKESMVWDVSFYKG